jgi:hypothetical protein
MFGIAIGCSAERMRCKGTRREGCNTAVAGIAIFSVQSDITFNLLSDFRYLSEHHTALVGDYF